jgi:death on curing protein
MNSLAPLPEHVTAMILSLAAGEVGEQSLARWIRNDWPKSQCYPS